MSAITANAQQRDMKVFEWINNFGQQSIRKMANALGMTVSQVQRSTEALSKRDCRPESHYWETRMWRSQPVELANCIGLS